MRRIGKECGIEIGREGDKGTKGRKGVRNEDKLFPVEFQLAFSLVCK
jgi:hypothetical protein